jgi:hypothetical protein
MSEEHSDQIAEIVERIEELDVLLDCLKQTADALRLFLKPPAPPAERRAAQ